MSNAVMNHVDALNIFEQALDKQIVKLYKNLCKSRQEQLVCAKLCLKIIEKMEIEVCAINARREIESNEMFQMQPIENKGASLIPALTGLKNIIEQEE